MNLIHVAQNDEKTHLKLKLTKIHRVFMLLLESYTYVYRENFSCYSESGMSEQFTLNQYKKFSSMQ